MLMWIIALALAAAAIGAALLALGLRGRRVNNHPHCRRCRFDLSGLDIEAAGAKCPECGGGLSEKRSIRIGARRKRPRLIVSGAAMLLMLTAVGGGAIWIANSNINWTPHKPAWLLEHEVYGVDSVAARIAAAELLRRAESDALSPKSHRRIAERAASSYAEYSYPLATDMNDIIEHAWRRGVIGPETMRTLAGNAVRIEFESAEDASEHGPIHYRETTRASWHGSGSMGMALDLKILSATIGDTDLLAASYNVDSGETLTYAVDRWATAHRPSSSDRTGNIMTSTRRMLPDSTLPLGEHEMEFVLSWRMRIGDPRTGWMTTEDASYGSVIVEWEERRTVPVRIVPEHKLTPIAVIDESLAAAVAEALQPSAVTVRRREGMLDYIQLPLVIQDLPIPIAGEYFLRTEDAEWPMRRKTVLMPGYTQFMVDGLAEAFDAKIVDLVIRPRQDYARFAMGVREYWGREIVIPDVPVISE